MGTSTPQKAYNQILKGPPLPGQGTLRLASGAVRFDGFGPPTVPARGLLRQTWQSNLERNHASETARSGPLYCDTNGGIATERGALGLLTSNKKLY